MVGTRILRVLSVACVMIMVLTGFSMLVLAKKDDDSKVRVIVTFTENVDKDLVKKHGGQIRTEFSIVPGVATELTQDEIKELKMSDKIDDVEEDGVAEIAEQTTPWGITQIKANQAWAAVKGAGIKVAVMDTGIDANHPDLPIVAKGVKILNGVTTENVYDDDNGHGTHCAGIIGALDNTDGVVGVAPAVSLYAIKVLDSSGSGYYSDMIKGFDWAITNQIQVISMSFGGTSTTKALQNACNNAQAKGIVLVAAAGNGGNSKILYPAAYSSVIAVGATGVSNVRASWSSYGSQLALVAPGVNIQSTYNDGAYTTMSGTSMACPHVSGTAALVLSTTIPTKYDTTPKNGKWDPAEVRNCLQQTATDLGTKGWDKYYGYGLVNAYEAVTGNHGV